MLFACAVEHLIGAKVLPRAATLWRLVVAAREHADERGLVLTRDGAVRRYPARGWTRSTFTPPVPASRSSTRLDALQRTARQRHLTPRELPTELIPRHWRALVEPEPGRLDRRDVRAGGAARWPATDAAAA